MTEPNGDARAAEDVDPVNRAENSDELSIVDMLRQAMEQGAHIRFPFEKHTFDEHTLNEALDAVHAYVDDAAVAAADAARASAVDPADVNTIAHYLHNMENQGVHTMRLKLRSGAEYMLHRNDAGGYIIERTSGGPAAPPAAAYTSLDHALKDISNVLVRGLETNRNLKIRNDKKEWSAVVKLLEKVQHTARCGRPISVLIESDEFVFNLDDVVGTVDRIMRAMDESTKTADALVFDAFKFVDRGDRAFGLGCPNGSIIKARRDRDGERITVAVLEKASDEFETCEHKFEYCDTYAAFRNMANDIGPHVHGNAYILIKSASVLDNLHRLIDKVTSHMESHQELAFDLKKLLSLFVLNKH